MRLILQIILMLFLIHTGLMQAQEMTLDEQLIVAADQGDSLSVQKLVRMGANINSVTYEGVTPLMFASMNGHNEIVRYLLKQGASADKQANDGNSALILAILSGQIETAEILIRNGANINLNDNNQVSPLMHAIEVDSFYIPDMLLYYGADAAHKDLNGRNALMLASRYGSVEIAIELLEAGLDVNEKDNDGNTPLHYATSSGKLEMMDLLVLNGADPDVKNKSGFSPLAEAVSFKNYKATVLLIGYGADVNSKISKSLNPLTLASTQGSDSIRNILIKNDAHMLNRPYIDKFTIGLSYSFNRDDNRMGFDFGYNDSRFGFMPSAGYAFRAKASRVLQSSDETTYYQFWEHRHYLFLTLDKAFFPQTFSKNFKTSAFAGLSGVFTFGSYKGSNTSPNVKILPVPRVGAFILLGNVRTRFSYDFMNLGLKNYDRNWFSLSIEFLFNTRQGKINLP